jgi:hypothetical protein
MKIVRNHLASLCDEAKHPTRHKKVALAAVFYLVLSLALQAAPPAPKDTAVTKNGNVELRGAYYDANNVIKPRQPSPPPGSIRIDRNATVHNYKPADLVRRIFLNSFTLADMERIQNVRHIGWNWGPNATDWATPTNLTPLTVYAWGGLKTIPYTYDSDERSLLYFERGDADPAKFEFENGLVLSTGPGLRIEGPNSTHHGLNEGFRNDGMKGVHNEYPKAATSNYIAYDDVKTNSNHDYQHRRNQPWNSAVSFDRDLDDLPQDTLTWTANGSVLEFDFQPAVEIASFEYMFASDEYPEGVYMCNDVFGFFVTGPYDEPPGHDIENTAATPSLYDPTTLEEHTRTDEVYYRYNIARLPDNHPVGINYVNWGSIDRYFYNILPYGYPLIYGGDTERTWNVEFYKDHPDVHTHGTYELPDYTYPSGMTPALAAATGYKTSPSNPTPLPDELVPRKNVTSGDYYFVPTNPHLFRYNYQDEPLMEYDGYTVKLKAVADRLLPGKWYHLKLAVANTVQQSTPVSDFEVDQNHGSGVFLANLNLGQVEGDVSHPYLYEAFDELGRDEAGNDHLFAQNEDVCIRTYDGDCDSYEMRLRFDAVAAESRATVFVSYIRIDPAAVQTPDGQKLFSWSDTWQSDVFQLTGPSDTLRSYPFKFSTDYPGFKNGQYVGIVVSIQGSMDTVVYGPLYRHATYDPVFFAPSLRYKGVLELNTQDGSPQLHRSVNGGATWKLASVPFEPWEIQQATELGYILLREPNSGYRIDTVILRVLTPAVKIQRPVYVPCMADVQTVPPCGVHYVPSGEDFVLTVIPKPGSPQALVTPLLATDRQRLSDSESIRMTRLSDGSSLFTIHDVREPVHITIDFISQATGAGSVSDRAVWSNGERLYIAALEPGVATVYTLTGTTFQTLLHAGGSTTSATLPAGLYIVAFNGKNYKISIRQK